MIVTSVNGARELRRRLPGTPRGSRRSASATADAFGGADLVPAVSTQEGLLAELPRPAGRVLFAGAEGARRLLVDELGADFVAALPHARARRRASRPTATSSCSRPRRPRAPSARLGVRHPGGPIGPQTTPAAREAGVEVVAEAETHDLDGLLRGDRPPRACSSPS